MYKGYYETSIEQIGSRVGIAKGTVSLHFRSKEDLVFAIFERDMQKLAEFIDATVSSSITARGKLEAILQFTYGGLFSRRMQLLSSLANTVELRRIFLEKKACTRDIWEQLSVRIASVLDEGKAAGEFAKTLPTRILLSEFTVLLSHRSYQ